VGAGLQEDWRKHGDIL